MSDQIRERSMVVQMFEAAERQRDYPGTYFPARSRARAALAAWREKYPTAAAAEDARNATLRIARERELAEVTARVNRDPLAY